MSPGLLDVTYRLAEEQDLRHVYDLYMDEKANPFLTYDPMPLAAFERLYHDLLFSRTLYVVYAGQEIAGSFRLDRKAHRQSGTVYLGGFVVGRSFSGQGIGHEMLQLIRKFASENGIIRVELTVDLNNHAAIHLYKKNGFEIEGINRKSYRFESSGPYYDEYMMSLIL